MKKLTEAEFDWAKTAKQIGNELADSLMKELQVKVDKELGREYADSMDDLAVDAMIHLYGRLRYWGYDSPDRNALSRLGYR